MSSFSIQEAQDFSAFALQTVERLAAAQARFDSAHDEPTEERRWLEIASARVTSRLENVQKALSEAAALPEFASARKVNREALSNAWADAIEGVFDAIVANVSANGPLVEALFPHQRFATLRKPGSSAASESAFCTSSRRLVTRELATSSQPRSSVGSSCVESKRALAAASRSTVCSANAVKSCAS